MKLLAIDTSTDYLTLAVTDGARVLARMHRKAPRSHSSLLVPMVGRALGLSRLAIKDIDAFCVGAGPGSFTGLRIGVATVKGFSYVTRKPIAAVPTFDAIAMNARKVAGTICVALDARKTKVYGALYRSDGKGRVKRISRYLLVSEEELLKNCAGYDNLYFTGDYAARIAARAARGTDLGPRWHPRAEAIARIGADMIAKGRTVTPEGLEPMYLYSRECDITGM
jgi:tRNA threonylcarbamoyladenosine biosynthesis protein TsaB